MGSRTILFLILSALVSTHSWGQVPVQKEIPGKAIPAQGVVAVEPGKLLDAMPKGLLTDPHSNFGIHFGKYMPIFLGGAVIFAPYNRTTTVGSLNIVNLPDQVITSTVISNSTATSITGFSASSLSQTSVQGTAFENVARQAHANYLVSTGVPAGDANLLANQHVSVAGCGADCLNNNYYMDVSVETVGPIVTNSTTVQPAVVTQSTASTATNSTSQIGNKTVKVGTIESVQTVNSTVRTVNRTTLETQTIDTQTRVRSVTNSGDGALVGTQTDQQVRTDTEVADENVDDTTTTETKTKTTKTQEITNTQKQGPQSWKLKIVPSLFFDYSSSRKLTSLNKMFPNFVAYESAAKLGKWWVRTETTKDVAKASDVADMISPLSETNKEQIQLNYAVQEGQYKIVQTHAFDLSVGAAAVLYAENPKGINKFTFGFFALAPIYGKDVTSEQVVDSYAIAKKVKPLSVPLTANIVKDWKPGSRVVYASHTGISAILGASVGLASAGVCSSMVGNWAVEVEKLGEVGTKLVRVGITNGSLDSGPDSLNACLNIGPIGTSYKNKVDQKSLSWNFFMDLDDPLAAEAYKSLFVKGKVDAVQALAENQNVKTVVAISKSDAHSVGVLTTANIGIPWVYWKWSKGDYHTAYAEERLHDGQALKGELGVYMEADDSRLFNYGAANIHTNTGFVGAQFDTTKRDGSKSTEEFGQFFYSYVNENATPQKLRWAFSTLVRQTGLKKFGWNVANSRVNDPIRFVGHADIKAMITFDSDATNRLIAFGKSRAGLDELTESFNSLRDTYLTEQYLRKDEQHWNLCFDYGKKHFDDEVTITHQGGRRDPDGDWKSCQKKALKSSNEAWAQMMDALKTMIDTQKTNRKAFVKAYSTFGKHMMTNGITFRTVFSKLIGKGTYVNFLVDGEQLAQVDLSRSFEPKTVNFKE